MEQLENLLSEASKIEKEYKEGLSYKKQMGYLDKWAIHERFISGDQWPQTTDKTKNLPRPIFNIIKQIVNHKVASVMNENIKMIFTANDAEEESMEVEAADKFTRYSDTVWENLKQDQLNEEALQSGAITGACIWHYFWDTSKSGGNRLKYVGDIAGEIIDAVNFFPGNPQNHRVQEQPYIIITYRDLIDNVKKEAEAAGISKEMINMITPDSETEDQAYDMAKQELTEETKVTVLTKYWKAKDGFIHFKKVASGIVVKKDTNTHLKLYPLVVMQWERRKRSIFGSSDVEGLIPNQKAINFIIAMQILSVELTGWPKLIIDKTLVNQPITNSPGEVISVNTGSNGNVNNSIQYLNPAQMSSQSFNLVESLLSYTKEVAGANENALGEQSSGQLNATAIMLLQKASGVPLESIKRRFYQACEDIGLIWSEFWKAYYNTDRNVTLKDDNGDEYTDTFNGEQYTNVDMNLKIDIGPSSSYSESLMMTSLDKLFDTQHIDIKQYLQYAPKNVIPFKDRLLKDIQEKEEQAMMMQQQQQEEAFQQALMQLSPEEQQAYLSASPEMQQQIKTQMMQEQPQQAPMM